MKYGTQKERRLANMNFDEIAFKNRKQIVQLSKSGEKIKEWHGITTAAKALGIERRDISSCCKGKIKSAGGYVWRYLDAERERTTG